MNLRPRRHPQGRWSGVPSCVGLLGPPVCIEVLGMVGPFIFMDQGGPLTLPRTTGGGVPEHPHAGLSTFTYLLQGRMMHADSAGNAATIQSGDNALMTSGSGITHEELPDATDSSKTVDIYFVQMWLALPDAFEETAPAFEHYRRDDLPVVTREGATARLAMGSAWGETAPTTCHAPTIFADIELSAGGSIEIPHEYDEQSVMLLEGDAQIGDEKLALHDLNVLATAPLSLRSENGGRVILLGGARFPTPRYIASSFVASSRGKLNRWIRDSASGSWPRIRR